MKHVHIVAHAEGDKSGEPRYVGAVMDVTKRKRAEEELATRQGQLEEAQALAHLGSWNWDIPTGSLTWSEELYRVFGVNPVEFVLVTNCFWSTFILTTARYSKQPSKAL